MYLICFKVGKVLFIKYLLEKNLNVQQKSRCVQSATLVPNPLWSFYHADEQHLLETVVCCTAQSRKGGLSYALWCPVDVEVKLHLVGVHWAAVCAHWQAGGGMSGVLVLPDLSIWKTDLKNSTIILIIL